MEHRRPNSLRLSGFNYSQLGAYFVTICCNERKPVFANSNRATAAWNFLRTRFLPNGDIGAAVILHDHLHLIIEIRSEGESSLGMRVKEIKVGIRLALKATGWSEPNLWQPNYYDHVIRNEQDWFEKANYMQNNPVRAGLVDDADKWPYWWGIGINL